MVTKRFWISMSAEFGRENVDWSRHIQSNTNIMMIPDVLHFHKNVFDILVVSRVPNLHATTIASIIQWLDTLFRWSWIVGKFCGNILDQETILGRAKSDLNQTKSNVKVKYRIILFYFSLCSYLHQGSHRHIIYFLFTWNINTTSSYLCFGVVVWKVVKHGTLQ